LKPYLKTIKLNIEKEGRRWANRPEEKMAKWEGRRPGAGSGQNGEMKTSKRGNHLNPTKTGKSQPGLKGKNTHKEAVKGGILRGAGKQSSRAHKQKPLRKGEVDEKDARREGSGSEKVSSGALLSKHDGGAYGDFFELVVGEEVLLGGKRSCKGGGFSGVGEWRVAAKTQSSLSEFSERERRNSELTKRGEAWRPGKGEGDMAAVGMIRDRVGLSGKTSMNLRRTKG